MDKYKIEMPGVGDIVKRFGLGSGGIVQKLFSNELMRISDNYAPFDQGALKNSATIENDGTSIHYNVPYARVHWYGKVMAGIELPKQATDTDMQYRGAPTRGARWVERAYADNMDAFIEAMEKKLKGL